MPAGSWSAFSRCSALLPCKASIVHPKSLFATNTCSPTFSLKKFLTGTARVVQITSFAAKDQVNNRLCCRHHILAVFGDTSLGQRTANKDLSTINAIPWVDVAARL
jgi:hypothetical protein